MKCKSPEYLQIELTNKCNLSCKHCTHNDTSFRNRQFDYTFFCKIIDSMPAVKQISFTGNGETLLVDNFHEFTSYCQQKGITTSITTNGSLIHCRIDQLAKAKLNKLIISFDAATQGTIDLIRCGLDLDKLCQNTKLAVNTLSTSLTQVCASITLSTVNIHEFPDILTLIATCGIDYVYVEGLHHWGTDKHLNDFSVFSHSNFPRLRDIIEKGIQHARAIGITLNAPDLEMIAKTDAPRVCMWPFDSMYITSDGNIMPCCINIEENEYIMGNLFQHPWETVWGCSAYESFRDKLLSVNPPSCCTECIYNLEFGVPYSQLQR